MSFAVLHINKASGSATAIARHIERSSQPDNAHPELRHLNRDDFIRYPEGIADLEGAIRHRIAHSGITRKVADNQVLALNVLMTSDGEALRRIADEGRLDEWAAVSIGWAKRTFGEDNVVGAHLHIDERTPHLHVTVVPIVTTERKKKAKEAKATKRYRKKAANAPRLCADDLMQRDKLTAYQDTYAEAMRQFGLERGIRGSEARHVSQHEYYRKCQIEKKDLEQDISELTGEKKELESRNRQLERGNRYMEKTFAETKAANAQMVQENTDLQKEKAELVKSNKTLISKNTILESEKSELEVSKKKVAAEITGMEAEKSKLKEECSAYAEEAETAKQERDTAVKEAADAKAQRDANRKDAFSNLANCFTGSKTKKLETALADKEKELEQVKQKAEASERGFRNQLGIMQSNLDSEKFRHESIERGFKATEDDLNTFFPEVLPMLDAARECRDAGLTDKSTRLLLDQQPRTLSKGCVLHSDVHDKDFDASGATVQIKRDPTDGNRFHLHVNGTRIAQWFRDMWQKLKSAIRRGPKIS